MARKKMKTRYNLTLIGTVLAISALSVPFIISETSPKPEIPNTFDHQLIDTLVEFGCSELAIYHLMDYSNLLDEEFNGKFALEEIGLPDGLSDEDFDKCVQIAISIRESNYTILPEPEPLTLEQMQSMLNQAPKEKHEPTHEKGEYPAPRDLSRGSNLGTFTTQPILTDEQLHNQIDIVFGGVDWPVYPIGDVAPENFTVAIIYKDNGFGSVFDFEAMLDDKIFVDRCESNGGTWNYNYHDCEELLEICQDVGGIRISRDITPYCISEACTDVGLVRMSCVFRK